MTNYAQIRFENTMDKINLLKLNAVSDIPTDQWDEMYLIIKGTKGFFDELSWDQILLELSDSEFQNLLSKIKLVRQDQTFREFYECMKTVDELIPLVKERE